MANYDGAVRTNYFHVKDAQKFMALMGRSGSDDDIDLWLDRVDEQGNPLYGFGCYGGIPGTQNDDGEYDEISCDRFIDGLKECVADDDAILIFEAGFEKLRYVGGNAYVVTSKGVECIDLITIACEKARQAIGNDQWDTVCVEP